MDVSQPLSLDTLGLGRGALQQSGQGARNRVSALVNNLDITPLAFDECPVYQKGQVPLGSGTTPQGAAHHLGSLIPLDPSLHESSSDFPL